MKKKLIAMIVTILLFTSILPTTVDAAVQPSQKEEVVYGILNSEGSVNNLYVVNIYNGGEVTDYGNYTKVQNLTTTDKIHQNSDQININSTAKRLYCKGTLESKELPWNIAIKYLLNGKEIPSEELAGKSGALQIAIAVTQNTKVDRIFFDNYALQIALQLDTKLCDNIKADNATIAEAGGNKQLSFTVMPGKGTDISVTADVHDYEMDPIAINGIKLVLDMNINYDEFSGEFDQLVDGVKELDNGAGDLLDGTDQLKDGMQQYIDGLKAYKDGVAKLNVGIGKLNVGATAINDGLSELAKQNDSLVNGALAIQNATFDTVNTQLNAMGLGLPVLTPQNYSKILTDLPSLSTVKIRLDNTLQFTEGIKGYTGGVAQLGSGASDLADGISQLKASTSKLTSSANDLYNAGVALNTAIKKLHDGLATYKDGTKELRDGTSDIDTQISDKIDEFIDSTFGSGDQVISFVSEKNTNISSVQFVLKTTAIKKPVIDNTAPEKNEKLTFWQKFLKLFGL